MALWPLWTSKHSKIFLTTLISTYFVLWNFLAALNTFIFEVKRLLWNILMQYKILWKVGLTWTVSFKTKNISFPPSTWILTETRRRLSMTTSRKSWWRTAADQDDECPSFFHLPFVHESQILCRFQDAIATIRSEAPFVHSVCAPASETPLKLSSWN